MIWFPDPNKKSKIVISIFSTWCFWVTHPSRQRVIMFAYVFFFITDVQLLSDRFYSLLPKILQRCVCVCVCVCARVCVCVSVWKASSVLKINSTTDNRFLLLSFQIRGVERFQAYKLHCMFCKQKCNYSITHYSMLLHNII